MLALELMLAQVIGGWDPVWSPLACCQICQVWQNGIRVAGGWVTSGELCVFGLWTWAGGMHVAESELGYV